MSTVLRQHAEQQFAQELAALAATDTGSSLRELLPPIF